MPIYIWATATSFNISLSNYYMHDNFINFKPTRVDMTEIEPHVLRLFLKEQWCWAKLHFPNVTYTCDIPQQTQNND